MQPLSRLLSVAFLLALGQLTPCMADPHGHHHHDNRPQGQNDQFYCNRGHCNPPGPVPASQQASPAPLPTGPAQLGSPFQGPATAAPASGPQGPATAAPASGPAQGRSFSGVLQGLLSAIPSSPISKSSQGPASIAPSKPFKSGTARKLLSSCSTIYNLDSNAIIAAKFGVDVINGNDKLRYTMFGYKDIPYQISFQSIYFVTRCDDVVNQVPQATFTMAAIVLARYANSYGVQYAIEMEVAWPATSDTPSQMTWVKYSGNTYYAPLYASLLQQTGGNLGNLGGVLG